MATIRLKSAVKNWALLGTVLVLSALGSSAANATVIVPGTADIWACNGVASPNDQLGSPTVDISPVLALSNLTGIASVTIFATGETSNCPSCYVPNGAGSSVSHLDGAFNGLPNLNAPLNSLVGAWINPLNSLDDVAFEIGTGGTFAVPTGATELFLGSMDAYQWNNNAGQFSVNVQANPVPEPLTLTVFAAAGLGGAFAARRRKKI